MVAFSEKEAINESRNFGKSLIIIKIWCYSIIKYIAKIEKMS
jgi:hypothetical protein